MTTKMPVLFQAHGAPMLLDDAGWVAELAGWATALPRPKAILVLSAHWESRPLAIGATRPLPLIYDFYGFSEKFYRLTYPSPGAPELAARVRGLLLGAAIPTIDEPARGLDHGTYIPLMCMYPAADVPVLQISLPSEDPQELFAVGRRSRRCATRACSSSVRGSSRTTCVRSGSATRRRGRGTSTRGARMSSRGTTSTRCSTTRRVHPGRASRSPRTSTSYPRSSRRARAATRR